jgi:5'-phosphate synthase pdxT subunit
MVRQENVLATSFHPELTADRRVHEYFTQMVRSALVGKSRKIA